jgi:hypothetical protein
MASNLGQRSAVHSRCRWGGSYLGLTRFQSRSGLTATMFDQLIDRFGFPVRSRRKRHDLSLYEQLPRITPRRQDYGHTAAVAIGNSHVFLDNTQICRINLGNIFKIESLIWYLHRTRADGCRRRWTLRQSAIRRPAFYLLNASVYSWTSRIRPRLPLHIFNSLQGSRIPSIPSIRQQAP